MLQEGGKVGTSIKAKGYHPLLVMLERNGHSVPISFYVKKQFGFMSKS